MNLSFVFANFLPVLRNQDIYKYLIPGAVVTLLYGTFMWSMGWLSTDPVVNSDDLAWSAKLIYWFTTGVRWFSTMLFEFVVITLFSPIMAMLSERVESIVTGKNYAFSVQRFVKELLRTIGILVSGFIFSTAVILIWSMVSWIGDFQAITPYIVFVIKAFFIGFNYVDYSLERNMIPVAHSWRYAVKRPIMMLVTGSTFSIIFAAPVFGVMFAPFIATIFATLLFLAERTKKAEERTHRT
jgi:CysZ protein